MVMVPIRTGSVRGFKEFKSEAHAKAAKAAKFNGFKVQVFT
jgi:hypothetical protein